MLDLLSRSPNNVKLWPVHLDATTIFFPFSLAATRAPTPGCGFNFFCPAREKNTKYEVPLDFALTLLSLRQVPSTFLSKSSF